MERNGGAAEVGFAVADAEEEGVDVLDFRVRVGEGAVGERHVLVGVWAAALLPGRVDRGWHLAPVRVIDVRALAATVIIIDMPLPAERIVKSVRSEDAAV